MDMLAAKLTSESTICTVDYGTPKVETAFWFLAPPVLILMIYLLAAIRRGRLLPKAQIAKIQELPDAATIRSLVTENRSLLSILIRAGLDASGHGVQATAEAIRDQAALGLAKLRSKVEWLAVLAGISFLVSFGANLLDAIEMCFDLIRKGGSPSPYDILGNLGFFLLGLVRVLALVVPPILVYRILKRRAKVLVLEAQAIAQDVIRRVSKVS